MDFIGCNRAQVDEEKTTTLCSVCLGCKKVAFNIRTSEGVRELR